MINEVIVFIINTCVSVPYCEFPPSQVTAFLSADVFVYDAQTLVDRVRPGGISAIKSIIGKKSTVALKY